MNDIPLEKKKFHPDPVFKRSLLLGWILSFVATIHLTFLPSILPTVLQGFQLVGNIALKSAGFIIMAYTATAILGNYFLSRLSTRVGLKKVLTVSCLSAAFFLVLLIVSRGVMSFMVIRMIQMFFIASIIPLTFSLFARDVGGKMIGFLNSSRFVGSAIGPLMATFVLAYSNLLTLYLFISMITLGSLWVFLRSFKTGRGEVENSVSPSA